jgi:hypothetical protein
MKIIKIILCSLISIFQIMTTKTVKRNKNCNELREKVKNAEQELYKSRGDYKLALRREIDKNTQIHSDFSKFIKENKNFDLGNSMKVKKKLNINSWKKKPENFEKADLLLSVIVQDWEDEIADVIRLAKTLRVLKVANLVDSSVLGEWMN